MLESDEPKPYLFQVDGEILDYLPVNYECIKEGYEFIRPELDEVAEAFKEEHGRYFWECNYD
jgi:hypothetical protein